MCPGSGLDWKSTTCLEDQMTLKGFMVHIINLWGCTRIWYLATISWLLPNWLHSLGLHLLRWILGSG